MVEFAISAEYRMKIKESEKIDKYLDLARELRKVRNMRAMAIPVVIGALGKVPEGLVRGWRSWKSEDESRPCRLLHCRIWLEY